MNYMYDLQRAIQWSTPIETFCTKPGTLTCEEIISQILSGAYAIIC